MKVGYFSRDCNLTLVWQLEQWADRNLKAKGLRPLDMIVSREMTLDEIADYADGCSQLLFTKYENVVSNFEAFSNDEAKCGVPSEFVERVRRLTLHQTDAKNGNMNEVPAKNQGAV